jgi:hypothetical protein
VNFFTEIKRNLRKPGWLIINFQTWCNGPWYVPGLRHLPKGEQLKQWALSQGYIWEPLPRGDVKITHPE